jgi:hypothetical protein
MANNIIEAIQSNLGYPPLQKVDPNSQDAKDSYAHGSPEKLGQAAIPAVLAAIYKFTRTDKGCGIIVSASGSEDWLSVIYAGKETAPVEKVAQYAGADTAQAESHMENIADEAVRVIKSESNSKPEKVKTYVSSQRHTILQYLPAAINMGDVLDDETIDDKTNKMEGPVSNFMHKIENTFSDGDSAKKDYSKGGKI